MVGMAGGYGMAVLEARLRAILTAVRAAAGHDRWRGRRDRSRPDPRGGGIAAHAADATDRRT